MISAFRRQRQVAEAGGRFEVGLVCTATFRPVRVTR